MPRRRLTVGSDDQINDEMALVAHERLMAKIRGTHVPPRDPNVARKARSIESSFPRASLK